MAFVITYTLRMSVCVRSLSSSNIIIAFVAYMPFHRENLMNNKFKCANTHIICGMTKLFMVFMSKVPNVVRLPRSHKHTHSVATKVMHAPYWMRHKISDDLTTIWFNIVNACILCRDFKWHIKIHAGSQIFVKFHCIILKWGRCYHHCGCHLKHHFVDSKQRISIWFIRLYVSSHILGKPDCFQIISRDHRLSQEKRRSIQKQQ